ncbi:MAG: VWA containing CoxE family protein [Clostridiales bacterium]|nr:VWA containing CoxE family protein [Clostridiales bacterium]
MFYGFFSALREEGVPVSLQEWLMLMEALSLELADNSLSEFYELGRSLLVKNEIYYDRYDAAFVRCFGSQSTESEKARETPELPKSERSYNPDFFNPATYENKTKQNAVQQAGQGLATTKNSEDKGTKEAAEPATSADAGETGSGGVSFADSPGGMTAVQVAGRRRYRDYRDDSLSNIRQFEMALRSLRLLSPRVEGPRDELNLDATIEETCRNGGRLSIEWDRPRKNSIRLILLMDSIGSIYNHHRICQRLFNAAQRSTHFKEIRYYYFHNCIYGRVYKDQWLDIKESVPLEDFFRLYNGDCRLLIVGDARMSERELLEAGGALDWSVERNREPGYTWLSRMAKRYPYAIWMNPVPEARWGKEPSYASINAVREIFPMYELNPSGIRKAVKKLRVK